MNDDRALTALRALEQRRAKAALGQKIPVQNEVKPDPVNWQAEAEFWQLKYFEERSSSQQVITALMRPVIAKQLMLQRQAAIQQQAQQLEDQLAQSAPEASYLGDMIAGKHSDDQPESQ